MVPRFNKLFTSLLLAIACAPFSNAVVGQDATTHRVRNIGRGLTIETFHPKSDFQVWGLDQSQVASFTEVPLDEAAVSFVKSRLDIDANNVAFKAGFAAGASKFAYVKQAHQGIPFANAVANVAWKDDKVVAFGSSFVKTDRIASPTPSLSVDSIIQKAEDALEGKYNGHPPSLEYLARSDGSVSLVHVIQVRNEGAGTWYEAFVDAHSGDILSVTDFVAHATYKALPITKEAYSDGVEIIVDPQDIQASPSGWHDDGTIETNNTSGNNVIAYISSQTAVTVQSSDGLVFNYTYDDTIDPTQGQNMDAARTTAFYIINSVHDLAYRYGFTESAFNFQNDNFGKGGIGGDRVLLSVQDSSGANNAHFTTPPDGQSGLCQMFLWAHTPVRRDGSLENGIIVHEMTHGISNRLTGGGTARCLQTTESAGMGEGWSDAMAGWTEQKSAIVADYVLGRYVLNNTGGARTYPYSTNATTNPFRYSSMAANYHIYGIGEIWANILHNVYAALVGQHGFSSTARTNPEGTEGNIIYMHLFMDALSLQPCNPTVISARDAWIQADVNRYAGANKCILWKGFASRGMGLNATNFVDDDTIPDDC